MNLTINTLDIENTIRMFRNISLLKIDTKVDDEKQHSLELIFYKSDSSEFQVYGASGTMLRDALTEVIENQYNYCNITELDENLFRISFKSIKGYCYTIR